MEELTLETILGSNLKKLPVYVRKLDVITELGESPKRVEIKSHNTRKFMPYPVHKPVSKFSGKKNEQEK
ncbi:MAG: hypothetical protein MK105_13560 [Crocinitomicaceae bacterium]|nr:hypothetical protein [Crocinitomicaceae bacterium]